MKVDLVSQSTDINNFKSLKKRRNLNIKESTSNKTIDKNSNLVKYGVISFAVLKFVALGVFLLKTDKNALKLRLETYKHPKDLVYRKRMLKNMGLSKSDAWKLRSIIGTSELTSLVKKNSKNPSVYNPGTRIYNDDGKFIKFMNENVNNHTFGANLHLHTLYSDGRISVQELLDKSVAYADERYKVTKQPFLFAITDHDSVEGCREAMKIIMKNPKKYKNLRLVLGCENTTLYNNDKYVKNPSSIHLLSYGIDPNSKDIEKFLISRIEITKSNTKSAIDYTNETLKEVLSKNNIQYSFEELVERVPALKYSNMSAKYTFKDYFQFKLLYASLIDNNLPLKNFLKENKVVLRESNWVEPWIHIPQYPDIRNKEYWEYYVDGLKKYVTDEVKRVNPNAKKEEILKFFSEIPDDIRNTMEKIETGTLDPSSKMSPKRADIPSFQDAVSKISKHKDGIMGIAHPGVFFPIDNSITGETVVKMYDDIYKNFTELGGKKARFSENFYQIYFKDKLKISEEMNKISDKYKLLKSGGLDTHGKDIFHGE